MNTEIFHERAQHAYQTRMPLLDGLRGLAILCVLVEHFGGVLAVPFDFGYFGVDLFFVLSGFLITGVILRMSNGPMMERFVVFFCRRSIRIAPPYYLTLLALWLFNYQNTRDHIFPLATYTWNYNCRNGGPFYLWSLSLEEQFYLIWPFLIWGLSKYTRLRFALVIVLTFFGFTQICTGLFEFLTPHNYTGLPSRLGSLCLGAMLALLPPISTTTQFLCRSRTLEAAIILCALLAMLSLRGFFAPYHAAALPASAICSLALVLKASSGKFAFSTIQGAIASLQLRFLGKISYGIYLLHVPLGGSFREQVFGPIWHAFDFSLLGPLERLRWHGWLLSFPLVVMISVAAAWLLWRFVEEPLSTWRDRAPQSELSPRRKNIDRKVGVITEHRYFKSR